MDLLRHLRRPEVVVGLLAFAASASSLDNGYVYDDLAIILQNAVVHSPDPARIWTSPYWAAGLLYRPVTVQLFALQWAIGGGSPLAFHGVNVFLMVVAALLFWRLARRLLPPAPALAASAFFAVHPVHVESVGNAVGQAELLAAIGALWAVERYLAWRETGVPTPRGRMLLALATLASTLSKEIAVVIPVLLVASEILLAGRRATWRERLHALAPTFTLQAAAVVAAVLARIIVLGPTAGAGPAVAFTGMTGPARIEGMLSVVPQWFLLLLWPAHLQAEYGPPGLPINGPFGTPHLIGAVLLLLLAWVFVLAWRKSPVAAFGILWVAVALFPVSNVLTATGVILAERTLFLPSVGAMLAVGAGLAVLLSVAQRRGAAAVRTVSLTIAALVLAGALHSSMRQRVWSLQSGFIRRLEADAPRTYRAQLVASTYYAEKSQLQDAVRTGRRALELYTGDPQVYEQLGQSLRRLNRCDEALPVLADGVRRFPDRTVARSRLIECSLVLGDTSGALRVAREGVTLGRTEFNSTIRRLAPP